MVEFFVEKIHHMSVRKVLPGPSALSRPPHAKEKKTVPWSLK